jgi:hypothetical protein
VLDLENEETAILQSVDKSLPIYTMSHPRYLTSSAVALRELRITFPIQYRQTDTPTVLCIRRTAVISTVTAILDNVTHAPHAGAAPGQLSNVYKLLDTFKTLAKRLPIP